MPALPTYKPPSYLSGVSGLCSLLFTDSTSSLIQQKIPLPFPSFKIPQPCLPKFSLHLQFLTRTQVRKWVLKRFFESNDIWLQFGIHIFCYLKISLWHGVTPEKPLKKENLNLPFNVWAIWYLETASSFAVWHESVTISLHQFQTLFGIYPIRRVIHLDIHLLPKSTITIFTLTPPPQQYFTWISILSVALCLGSKLCCGSTLFAVIGSTYCRNILIVSSSFSSFKVDSLESISGG